ncbi:endonuclease [Bacillus phage 000TH008]|nr:endonuclease [Bacillus phage 000TH008]QQO40747.1 endonuclease [Bacillus phage 000TH009]
MAKSEVTKKLERQIWSTTTKPGVFSCFEVTIGFDGRERVDYLTYDTKGMWRCYEIKATVSDFRSKAKKTFCGHYNYYVMPRELYEKVKDEIPSHIGVYTNGITLVKRAKRQELTVEEEVLTKSLIRSLHRDSVKVRKNEDPLIVQSLQRQADASRRERDKFYKDYRELQMEVINKFGFNWRDLNTETLLPFNILDIKGEKR